MALVETGHAIPLFEGSRRRVRKLEARSLVWGNQGAADPAASREVGVESVALRQATPRVLNYAWRFPKSAAERMAGLGHAWHDRGAGGHHTAHRS